MRVGSASFARGCRGFASWGFIGLPLEPAGAATGPEQGRTPTRPFAKSRSGVGVTRTIRARTRRSVHESCHVDARRARCRRRERSRRRIVVGEVPDAAAPTGGVHLNRGTLIEVGPELGGTSWTRTRDRRHRPPRTSRHRRAQEDEATGFDPEFLGVAAIMPRMGDVQAAASVELTYEHFTVMLDTVRRFAGRHRREHRRRTAREGAARRPLGVRRAHLRGAAGGARGLRRQRPRPRPPRAPERPGVGRPGRVAARANTDTFHVHERGTAGLGVQPVAGAVAGAGGPRARACTRARAQAQRVHRARC